MTPEEKIERLGKRLDVSEEAINLLGEVLERYVSGAWAIVIKEEFRRELKNRYVFEGLRIVEESKGQR